MARNISSIRTRIEFTQRTIFETLIGILDKNVSIFICDPVLSAMLAPNPVIHINASITPSCTHISGWFTIYRIKICKHIDTAINITSIALAVVSTFDIVLSTFL